MGMFPIYWLPIFSVTISDRGHDIHFVHFVCYLLVSTTVIDLLIQTHSKLYSTFASTCSPSATLPNPPSTIRVNPWTRRPLPQRCFNKNSTCWHVGCDGGPQLCSVCGATFRAVARSSHSRDVGIQCMCACFFFCWCSHPISHRIFCAVWVFCAYARAAIVVNDSSGCLCRARKKERDAQSVLQWHVYIF